MLGIDLVAVRDVRRSIKCFGERYLQRIYTAQELTSTGSRPERLAARFAAKEAVMKLLDIGGQALLYREIEVVRAPSGHVSIQLFGAARRAARRARIGELALSLTHQDDYAVAVVAATPAYGARQGTRRASPWRTLRFERLKRKDC
jgi:holo-[acyl-carrier protein] synthase